MNFSITLKNKEEIISQFTEEEYETLKSSLKGGKTKMVEIDNRLIATSSIADVKPISEPTLIPKERRLSEPDYGTKEERIKVPGGWQTIKARERMQNLFAKMKEQSCFKNFQSYEQWEREKYKGYADNL